jgi:Prokaryotic Cytochrome C oxidase subunit IV
MDRHEKRLALWWLVLVTLTVVSLEGAPALSNKALFTVALFIIAFIKVRIVVREFMEVRGAPLALRMVLDLWGVAVCAALIYLVAANPIA